MHIITQSDKIKEELEILRSKSKTIGFVPTMGALHEGHLTLIERAKIENDVVVCSIFVNPLQFNKEEDFNNYPDTIEEDKKQLILCGCDILFLPKRSEIFPIEPSLDYRFGTVGMGMEGEFRPGHFEGVAAVVEAFFRLLRPNCAYFGEKDFQQLAVVKWLVHEKGLNVNVVSCETKRNNSGLALSSRNMRLNSDEVQKAAILFETMIYCKNHKNQTPLELCKIAKKIISIDFELEYFIIADERTLEPINDWNESKVPRVFIAACLSGIRLIDNLSLID